MPQTRTNSNTISPSISKFYKRLVPGQKSPVEKQRVCHTQRQKAVHLLTFQWLLALLCLTKSNSGNCCLLALSNSFLQSQKAVSAHLKSEQILHFDFAQLVVLKRWQRLSRDVLSIWRLLSWSQCHGYRDWSAWERLEVPWLPAVALIVYCFRCDWVEIWYRYT